MKISIVIPASNEASVIGRCLGALAASAPVAEKVQVIVVANGCCDATVARAQAQRGAIETRGWSFCVIDRPVAGKIGALNAGDAAATFAARLYLDADVTPAPDLLPGLMRVLDRPEPVYASGRLRITAGASPASRAYARIWARVPFMARGVPGCGLFAVNAAGRARWGAFPEVIADDMFVRLLFAPSERVMVDARYDWPVSEGFGALVRVRRRQDRGVAEIAERFPELLANEDKARMRGGDLLGLARRAPLGLVVYAAVALRVRLSAAPTEWSRGR